MAYAVKKGNIVEVDDREPEYEFENPSQFFSSGVNLVPAQSAIAAPRAFYAARFVSQALPNPIAEQPLVQSLKVDDPDGRSWDEYYGEKAAAVKWNEPEEGLVSRVANDKIFVKTPKGTREIGLYKDLSLNRKTGLTQTPMVKAGDRLAPGQLLAKSNYTDDKGSLAMGVNLLIGLAPYKGFSMDDALVISESASKKLLSEKYHDYMQEDDGNIRWGKDHFRSLFPKKFNKDQLEKMDDSGVIKPGEILRAGDPVILATTPRTLSSKAGLGRLSRSMSQIRQAAEEVWDSDEEGVVTGVARTAKGVKVTVKTISPTKLGDKLVIRSGQKGINSKIIPDELMPRLKDGRPLEMLLNPLGIPSRVNDGLIYELLLGKVAKQNGAPIKVPSFLPKGQPWNQYVRNELQKAGIPEEEEVFDPESNKVLENPITVGYGYVLKLHHEAESKNSARNQGIYDCHDALTEVLTKRGWVHWSNVTAEDELFVPNLKKGKGVYEKPLRLVSYSYEGELIGYSSRKLDFLVTPNHRMVYATPKVREWRETEVEALYGRKVFIPRAGCELVASEAPIAKVLKLKRSITVAASNKDGRYSGRWFKQPYSGLVYCATTSTGLLVTRRNGKVLISGNSNQQPAKGGFEGAQAKRSSTLEVNGLRAAGAYNILRENSTIRGQRNDEFWRAWRAGRHPVDPGKPFVFDKFVALLGGAGIKVNNKGNGVLRLGPMTDKHLSDEGAVEVKNGTIMDFKTFKATPGGLFDNDITAQNKWGYINLPAPMPNPAYEDSIRSILGLKKQELEDILAGRMDLPERLR